MSKGEKRRRGGTHPSCENQQPTIRVKIHTPETRPVHRHIDQVFQVKAETDWECWAQACAETLRQMGYTHEAFIVGFIMDFINSFSKELRWEFVKGLFLGWGCEIEPQLDGSVYVRPANRYEPLGEPPTAERGIVLPGTMDWEKTKEGLVLP